MKSERNALKELASAFSELRESKHYLHTAIQYMNNFPGNEVESMTILHELERAADSYGDAKKALEEVESDYLRRRNASKLPREMFEPRRKLLNRVVESTYHAIESARLRYDAMNKTSVSEHPSIQGNNKEVMAA